MFRSLKMKSIQFLNNFLIVMCVTMYFVTCRPSSSVEYDNYYDMIGRCLTEMGCNADTIDRLNSTLANKLHLKANQKTMKLKFKLRELKYETNLLKNQLNKTSDDHNKEREYRLYFQSLIHIDEYVDDLFETAWPEWAPNKPNKKYTTEHFKILLSNVEDAKILAIRTHIEENNILEKDFIEEAKWASKLRHIENHDIGVKVDEREEAGKVLNNRLGPIKAEIFNILLIGRQLPPRDQFIDTVINKTNDARKGYRLLKIPNYEGPENHIARILDNYEIKNEYIKYNGLVVVDKAVYVTFENFLSAHYIWNKWVKNTSTAVHQRNAVILQEGIRLKEKNDMYVNVTIDKNEHAEFERRIYNKIKIYEDRPISKHTYRTKQPSTTDFIEIFYKFDKAYPAIRFYSLCKKEKPEMVRFLPMFKSDLTEHDANAIIFPSTPS